ncbi:hypothetical protein PHYBLDRAFT_61683 [Phycomyces blakesleeanus NRRL 1555(-)]|uniref:SWIRM domain-containing protein n=1 Tax=Phycomyces blakesleeanus (strain ATCC 8743b / DSM 1359 / FGSC 10004 / NBRC 33097 / NRRL 1555) TaxID=763407 RepID=A0A163BCJ1_PHYB8|nr:hypothetical protein PHYBLDRAFT_61683 [Phycomyces blakesleeanus NRRL 1555(-)]OAD80631.1 hypothetical protein PHYBLDRAFT_61683 [Phycomyces blakesleeanus NRRL 1555(-)]|eukprot:XP_018298671.1 hypothetical protein PHYBLDRAFT_61683 [Phycomyces blakesleeanus NRRL 1555(-)]
MSYQNLPPVSIQEPLEGLGLPSSPPITPKLPVRRDNQRYPIDERSVLIPLPTHIPSLNYFRISRPAGTKRKSAARLYNKAMTTPPSPGTKSFDHSDIFTLSPDYNFRKIPSRSVDRICTSPTRPRLLISRSKESPKSSDTDLYTVFHTTPEPQSNLSENFNSKYGPSLAKKRPVDKDQHNKPNFHATQPSRSEVLPKKVKIRVTWKGSRLTIDKLPFYDRLHPEEAIIASTLRLTPEQFLRCKRTLVLAAYQYTQKGLKFRKSDAQKLCRIDVNKTSALWCVFNRLGWFRPRISS